MAKKSTYPIHPDFQHYPAMPFPFNGLLVRVLNKLLHLDTFFRQGHIMRHAIKHKVTSLDGSSFTVFQFQPGKANTAKRPAILYFHGGAFVLTYASSHIQAMDFYAQQAQCDVFMVDYRLSPKHLFPQGFDDCYSALQWLQNNAEKLGIDASNIVAMGDSAGGALTAGVCQKAIDNGNNSIKAQVLIYPALDKNCSTNSARNYNHTPLFDSIANKKMWQIYLSNCQPGNIPAYASPADRSSLAGLPTAYVETAEFDPLSDEGAEYAQRLQASGVSVELNQTKGTIHGFDTVLTSRIAQDALQRRITFLNQIFSR
jgi:acetyl esterase